MKRRYKILVLPQETRRLTINGRRVMVTLENEVWDALFDICSREARPVDDILKELDQNRGGSSLATAVRLFVVSYFQHAAGLFETLSGGFSDADADDGPLAHALGRLKPRH